MTHPHPEDNDTPTTDDTTSRRRFIIGVAGAGAGVIGAGTAVWRSGMALGQDSDDNDNSGPGSGDDHDPDHDDDDDHSGPGRGGEDDHDEHDDDDDRDEDADDGVEITDEVPPRTTEVRIEDDDPDGFSPQTVTIDVGESVTWINAHDDPHTATGASFDTGIIQPGRIATVEFNEPGTFPYACEIHPEMTGTVEVRGSASATPEDGTPEAATPRATPESETSVDIRNFAFDPAEVHVSAGSTVTWTNQDQLAHTATASDGTFDTGSLNQGDSGSVTFDDPGTFDYECAIHPSMQGRVVVE
jgi:plastocyanin